LVDLLTDLRSCQDDFTGDEDKKNDFRLHHAVDQAREQLGLVAGKVVMLGGKTFQANRELDVT